MQNHQWIELSIGHSVRGSEDKYLRAVMKNLGGLLNESGLVRGKMWGIRSSSWGQEWIRFWKGIRTDYIGVEYDQNLDTDWRNHLGNGKRSQCTINSRNQFQFFTRFPDVTIGPPLGVLFFTLWFFFFHHWWHEDILSANDSPATIVTHRRPFKTWVKKQKEYKKKRKKKEKKSKVIVGTASPTSK